MGGEPEYGYFFVVALWPLLGFAFLTRQYRLLLDAWISAGFLYLAFLLLDASRGINAALVDYAGIATVRPDFRRQE